jgi:HAE1 family hydrophobic/amphiphilic exporter-1
MNLTKISVQRPVTTLMLFIGLIFLGFVSLSRLSVDFLPDISVPSLTVKTIYPYASPQEVETLITEPVESRLSTIAGVKKTSSISREGVSLVTVDFYWNVNMDYTMLEVREKLDQLRGMLPTEAKRPTILRVDPSTESMMTLVITNNDSTKGSGIEESRNKKQSVNGWSSVVSGQQSVVPAKADQFPVDSNQKFEARSKKGDRLGDSSPDGLNRDRNDIAGRTDYADLSMLKEFARSVVKRRMEQIEGVAMAEVTGGVEREIHVNLIKSKVELFNISLSEIENAIKESNVNIPGGTIKQGYFKLALRTVGEFVNLDDIRLLVVRKNKDGSVILLKDIANVTDSYKERTGVTHYNGNETVGLLIHKESGANTVETSKLIHQIVNEINHDYPNLTTKIVFDQAEFISKSLNDVESAILQGAFLAFIILFLFLKDFRSPIIIGITMPISILITFILMDLFNVNINIISLTGLALGIGMLGDNAIVIIENATRLREGGMSRLDAAIEGGKEINLAAAVSTFTNVAIFIPILYVEGVAKELFKDMALTMTFSLLASLVTAIMLVPMLISRETSSSPSLSRRKVNGGDTEGTIRHAGCCMEKIFYRIFIILSKSTK